MGNILDMDEALAANFKADLAGMDDEEIEAAIEETEEYINHETDWLEALCAEQRIRLRKASSE